MIRLLIRHPPIFCLKGVGTEREGVCKNWQQGNLLPRGINDFMRLAMLVNVLLTRISLHTGL